MSALLVTFREIAMQYQYFCFIHDKRANFAYLQDDVEFWIKNLWDNMLKTKEYISYGICIFHEGYDVCT